MSILLYYYLSFLVRTLITRTSSPWIYHTIPYMSYTLKTCKNSTRVLPKDWTRDLETYSTALWLLGYSNRWLCPRFSNLWPMFVSVRDIYNFYIETIYLRPPASSRFRNSPYCRVHTRRAVKINLCNSWNVPIRSVTFKVLAAHRSGLTTVVVPKANAKDVTSIPENVQVRLAAKTRVIQEHGKLLIPSLFPQYMHIKENVYCKITKSRNYAIVCKIYHWYR